MENFEKLSMEPVEELKELSDDSKMIDRVKLRESGHGMDVFKWSRLTDVILVNDYNTEVFAYPPESQKQECLAKGVYLKGVKNNLSDGSGARFNWVLSNGNKSNQMDDDWPTDYPHMMPEQVPNQIRSVDILYDDECIRGFNFFDQHKQLIWEIGDVDDGYTVNTVALAEDEVIIGVVAKLF